MIQSASFGAWLKERRKALGMTRDDLADQVGCAAVTIIKIERGQRRPSRQVAECIAAALRISPDEREAVVQWARGTLDAAVPSVPALSTQASTNAPAEPRALPEAVPARLDNLPAALNSFVGREQEVGRVGNLLLRADVRMLTLTGPPGIGKTRLSLTVASALRGEFEHGVWFVSLAPIQDPSLVLPTIAQAVGLKEASAQSIESVLHGYLRDKRLLLVLDNLEQLLEAAPLLSELLAAAPNVKALVTSRSPLHVYGEHEFPVPPLDLPDIDTLPAPEVLAGYPAVALFAERAQSVKPDFQLTSENAAAVARLCVRLDGLPLAIELAAARSKLFTPASMLEKLAGESASAPLLDLLAGGPRDRSDRQRTLRGALDWSYRLLDADEQTLFRRLSVFVGGRTLEAAESVCNAMGDLRAGIVDGVLSLVEKSLLQQQEGPGGEPRFWMLETIHSYAAGRLEESGEAETLRRAHAEYYLALTEQGEPHLRGAEQKRWLDRLESEHANIRAALGWALANGEGELAQRIAAAVWRFWVGRGHLSEGRAWLARAREADARRTSARAAACRAGATLAQSQSDYAQALALGREALDIFRELGDRLNEARSLNNLAIAEYDQGHLDEARRYFEESLRINRELGDSWGVAAALTNLGLVTMDMRDATSARSYHSEARELFQQLNDGRSATIALNNLAVLAHQEGNYAEARAMWQECAGAYREMGYKEGLGLALANLGVVARDVGEYEQARALYAEGLSMLMQMGNLRVVAFALDRLAGLAILEGRAEKAARLFGAADKLLKSTNAKLPTYNQQEHERYEAATRQALDDARFEALWREGHGMTTEAAIADALEL